MAKRMTQAQKTGRIVKPARSGESSRVEGTRKATTMVPKKSKSVNATKIIRSGQ